MLFQKLTEKKHRMTSSSHFPKCGNKVLIIEYFYSNITYVFSPTNKKTVVLSVLERFLQEIFITPSTVKDFAPITTCISLPWAEIEIMKSSGTSVYGVARNNCCKLRPWAILSDRVYRNCINQHIIVPDNYY